MKFRTKLLILSGLIAAVCLTACSSGDGSVSAEGTTNDTKQEIAQEPTATPSPANTATPTCTPTPKPRTYDMNEYVIVSDATGSKSVSADVSMLKIYSTVADYRVTALFSDGTTEQKTVRGEDGRVSADFGKEISKYEIVPVYRFSFGTDKKKDTDGYAKAKMTNVYSADVDYGFEGKVDSGVNGMAFKTDKSYFVLAVPDGMYDVTVTKTEDSRTTYMINDGAFAVNVAINGNGRKGSDRTYTATDIVVTGGEARFSVSGSQNIATFEMVRTSSLVERKRHIYIAGDSTVATYYPRLFKAEPLDGTAQTGWGQLFACYTDDSITVDGLGAGGTYAKSWYELYFKGIMNNAQPGDYFIIQEGINDRSYSSVPEMVDYLTMMIDACVEKQVIPVLVTSQQTAKFWKDAQGNDVAEFGEPEGSSLNPFMVAIRELAASKGVFLVDNAALTGKWYKIVGRTYVEQHYHLYNASTDTIADSLHSAYAGSKKIAGLIATDIRRQIDEGVKDAFGNDLSGIVLNPVTTYEFEHVNEAGETVKETVSEVSFDASKVLSD